MSKNVKPKYKNTDKDNFCLEEVNEEELELIYGGSDITSIGDPNEFHWDPWHRRRPKEPKTGS